MHPCLVFDLITGLDSGVQVIFIIAMDCDEDEASPPRMVGRSCKPMPASGRVRHFDPGVVDTFLTRYDEFAAIAGRHMDSAG
jgi:hypothetical protein